MVAIVDFPNGVGGDTRRVHMLARSLVAAGMTTALVIPCTRGLVPPPPKVEGPEIIDGIRVIRLAREGSYGHTPGLGAFGMARLFLLRWFSLFLSLVALLRLRFAGYRNFHLYQPTFYDGAAYWLLARLTGARVSADYSDLSFVDHDRIETNPARRLWSLNFRLGMTWLPARLDRTFVISRYLLASMASAVRPERLIRIPPVVDVAAFLVPEPDAAWRRRFGMPEGRVVLYAGAFFDNEGVPSLLEVAPRFLEGRPDVTLVVVGGHPADAWQRCRESVAGLVAADRIRFTGVRESLEMPSCFRAADVLVAPKADHLLNRAGVPTKLVEYLASGRPVVITRVGDIPELVTDGVDAVLVDPGNVPALGDAIAQLLDDPVRAARIGQAGRERARRDYDVAVIGRRLRKELVPESAGTNERTHNPS